MTNERTLEDILDAPYRRERTHAGDLRYSQSISYVWGREDAGDMTLRDALQSRNVDRVAEIVFASYAADESDAYAREERTSLPNVRDQYDALMARLATVRFVATINVPGYEPMDDDPPVFESAADAWEYLCDERIRGEDTDDESDAYSETVTELRALAAEGSGTGTVGTVYGATPGYSGDHDLGLAYSVSIAEDDR